MDRELGWSPRAYLRRLQGHLSWARARLTVYVAVAGARRDPETRGALELGRLFFQLAEDAFYLDAALTVQKVLDPRDQRGLPKYLRKSAHDAAQICYSSGFGAADIRGHLDQLATLDEPLARLRTLRDKWLAHHDVEAFEDPGAFSARFGVGSDELWTLIDTAQGVLTEHHAAFGVDFTPGLSRETDVVSVIDALQRVDRAVRQHASDPSDAEAIVAAVLRRRDRDGLRERWLGGRADPW